MGRNNQKRRAEKKRRDATRMSGSGGRSAWSSGRSGSDYDTAREIGALALGAATALASGDREDFDSACDVLRGYLQSGAPVVTGTVGGLFCTALASVFEGGWQPAEIVRQVRRRRSDRHVGVVLAALGAADTWAEVRGAPMPAAWAAQLDELGVGASGSAPQDWLAHWMRGSLLPVVDALPVILETLGVVVGFPDIAALLPRPSQWSTAGPAGVLRGPEEAVLAKIRALLAKAESTGFEAESDALTAKAQELMARHAIDDARARAERSSSERPVSRRVAIDDPYAVAKSRLLQVVAQANGVRAVWYEDLAIMALIGFAGDLDAVEVLFTSLLLQGSRAMLAKGSIRDERGRSRTRSFRQSFLVAFASRIRERLVVAATSARHAAEHELATSLLPVLAGRDREVDDVVSEMFPHLYRGSGLKVTNESGWRAGRVAAELATLGPDQGLLDGMAATG
jgi:hypothetical protein